jgi:uncharacterized membrane protein
MYLRAREPRQPGPSIKRRLLAFGAIVIAALVAFLVAPGTIASKTHVALHGLCAQRPSHSLQLGGATLPLDARMTGLYIGAATTVAWLLAAGRLRAARKPPRGVIALLLVGVVSFAGDGFNSLLADLRLLHLYPPSNLLRLITGSLAGIALGVTIGHLLAVSIWANRDHRRAVISGPTELLVPGSIVATLGVLAMSELPVLFAPFALGLLLAAVFVVSALVFVLLMLVTNRGWSSTSYRELIPPATLAVVTATVVIAALSALRIAAERLLGLPQLT